MTVPEQSDTRRLDSRRPYSGWLVLPLSILTAVVGILVGFNIRSSNSGVDKPLLNGTVAKILGVKGALLFSSLDVNGDGLINSNEFGPVVEKLTGEAPPVLVYKQSDEESGDSVTLYTEFAPVVFETMKTFEDEGVEGMMRNYKAMTGLRDWRSPHQFDLSLYSCEFKPFLPKAGDELIGRAYWIYKPHLEPWHQGDNGRYYPPNPTTSNEELLYKLLRMLHPQPFILTRFGPHGTAAVVQAYNSQLYKIRFRMHCEFQVNEPPQLPFWYTPSQMTGHMIISKDGLHLREFKMYLPSDRKLNIDMEWITKLKDDDAGEAEQMEVEIAYQPKMEIHTVNDVKEDYQWSESLSDDDANSAIEKQFYPFKEVTYYPLTQGFDKALTEDKLLHSIVLWGSLDDQSC